MEALLSLVSFVVNVHFVYKTFFPPTIPRTMKAISIIFSLVFLFAIAQTAIAQCPIPNAGFENWEVVDGRVIPISWETTGEISNDAQ